MEETEQIKPTPGEQLKNANGPIRDLLNEALQKNYEDLRQLSAALRQDEIKEHQELEQVQNAIHKEINIVQFAGSSFRFFYLKDTGPGREPIVQLYAMGNHYPLTQADHETLQAHVWGFPPKVHMREKKRYTLEWLSQGKNRVPTLLHPGIDQHRNASGNQIKLINSLASFDGKNIFVSDGHAYIVGKLETIPGGVGYPGVDTKNGKFPQQDGLPWLFGVTESVSTKKGIFLVNGKRFYKTDLTKRLTPVLDIPAGIKIQSAAYFQPIAIGLKRELQGRTAAVLAEHIAIRVALPADRPMPIMKKVGGDDSLFTFPQPISYFRDFTISFHLFFKHNGVTEDTVIIGGHRHLEILYRPVEKALVIRWNIDGLTTNYRAEEIVLDNALEGCENLWTTLDIKCKDRKLTVYIKGKPTYSDLKLPEAPPQDPLFPTADRFTLGNASHQSSVSFSLLDLRFFQRAIEDYELAQSAKAQLTAGDYGFPKDLRAVYPLGSSNSPVHLTAYNTGVSSDFMNRVNPNEFIKTGDAKLEHFSFGEYVVHPFMNTYTIASDQAISSNVRLCNRSGKIFYQAINRSTQCIMMQDICGTMSAVIVAEIPKSTDMEFNYDGATTEIVEEALNRKRTSLRLAHLRLERAREDAHLVIHHEMDYLEQEIEKSKRNSGNVAFLREQYNTQRKNWEELRPQSLHEQYKAIEESMEKLKTARKDAHEILHQADVQINALRIKPRSD